VRDDHSGAIAAGQCLGLALYCPYAARQGPNLHD
jgi:hypothetical protein